MRRLFADRVVVCKIGLPAFNTVEAARKVGSQPVALECRRNRHYVDLVDVDRRTSLEIRICRKPGGAWLIHD